MMHGFNNSLGMGNGNGLEWVIGLVVLVILIWVVVKVVTPKNKHN